MVLCKNSYEDASEIESLSHARFYSELRRLWRDGAKVLTKKEPAAIAIQDGGRGETFEVATSIPRASKKRVT